MIGSFASRALAPLVLRLALAVVFIYHGLPKVAAEAGYGMTWANKMESPPPGWLQAAVAWGEVVGGVALALGLFTRVAALGIIAIMAGAIATVHGVKTFGMEHHGFEYNFVLICIAAALVFAGAGVFSLDHVIRSKMKGPAHY